MLETQKNTHDLTSSEFQIHNYYNLFENSSIANIRKSIRKGLRGMNDYPEVYYMFISENPDLIMHDMS